MYYFQRWTLFKVLAFGVVVATLCAFAIAIVEVRRSVARTLHYATAFKLQHAFNTYLDINDCFPPRVATDFGRKLSWRMLLQLVVDQDGSEFRRDDPWDSDHNLKYAGRSPSIVYYSRPIGRPLPIASATFVAVTDLESILQDATSIRPNEVGDGLTNTLLVAQVPRTDIPWSEPRDLTFEEFCRACNPQFDAKNASAPAGYVGQLLLFADGKIFRVSHPLLHSDFKSLWTHSSGDGPDRNSLARDAYLEQQNDRQFDFGEVERGIHRADSNDSL